LKLSDEVLEGLGNLSNAHQIFQNTNTLNMGVLNRNTMPDEEELQELIRNAQE
jgi:hypothetical protein